MHSWVPLLFSSNYYNTVIQPHFNKKKIKEKKLHYQRSFHHLTARYLALDTTWHRKLATMLLTMKDKEVRFGISKTC